MRRRSELSQRAIQAVGIADSVLTKGMEVDREALAATLLDMAGEVQRLNAVIDNIVGLYTSVQEPLASYLRETGDLP